MAQTSPPTHRSGHLQFATATSWLQSEVLLVALVTGCMGSEQDEPHISMQASASTVADYEASGCSTAVVIGLSRQIAEQANCEHPGDFVAFTATNGITFTSSAVLPYLAQTARDDLQTVATNNPLQINSALRTLAQQYLLYHWYLQGRCGITAAATVGNSNHEGGRAVDLANYAARVTAMANQGWAHDVPGDLVHFDHLASPDHRGEDVHAFQTLWNHNHPEDPIASDGSYGPQTEARLRASPATGFDMGANCTAPVHSAQVVSVDGPDKVPPQTRAHYSITLKNSGTADWPATTQLELAMGMSSQLHDDSWTSATVITTIGAAVPAGAMGTVEFDVTTPAADAELAISETLQLADGSAMFGSFDFALTVEPGAMSGTSGDGNEKPGQVGGGCHAGGAGSGAGVPLVIGLAIAWSQRRRRRARRMRRSQGGRELAVVRPRPR
jgi:hypothetical protein